MSCINCFTDWVACGVDEIIIDAALPDGEFKVYIDNKGATHERVVNVEDGAFTLDVSSFPDGFFNPYAGPFIIFLGGCYDPLFCDEYNCMQFEVRNGDSTKNTITCCAANQE